MSSTQPQPDFEALAHEADTTYHSPMDVTSVRERRDDVGGWVVTATKCPPKFVDLIEAQEGLAMGTIYPSASGMLDIHVRVDE
jgi:hypothetical protein